LYTRYIAIARLGFLDGALITIHVEKATVSKLVTVLKSLQGADNVCKVNRILFKEKIMGSSVEVNRRRAHWKGKVVEHWIEPNQSSLSSLDIAKNTFLRCKSPLVANERWAILRLAEVSRLDF